MKKENVSVKIDSVSYKPNRACKRPALWVQVNNTTTFRPLVYFQKPKWVSEESFQKIVRFLVLGMPEEFKIEKIKD